MCIRISSTLWTAETEVGAVHNKKNTEKKGNKAAKCKMINRERDRGSSEEKAFCRQPVFPNMATQHK